MDFKPSAPAAGFMESIIAPYFSEFNTLVHFIAKFVTLYLEEVSQISQSSFMQFAHI